MNFKMDLKQGWQSLRQYCLMIGGYIGTGVRTLLEKSKVLFKDFYHACDLAMKNFAFSSEKVVTSVAPSPEKIKKFYWFAYAFATLIVLAIFALVIALYMYTVPVGSNAVVTRFGQYSRTVDAGFHFRWPLVERYFIVNTMNLMEETFGFRRPVSFQKTTPVMSAEDKYVDFYESRLVASEKDLGSVFSQKGNIFDSLSQMQRLPADYLKKKINPKGEATPSSGLTATQAEITLVPHELKYISADLNIIHLTWSLQYKIGDARQYLFNSRDVSLNIRDVAQAMMSEVIGDTIFAEVLHTGRQVVEENVKQSIQDWLDKYQVGILITQIIILDALPPPEVIPAFNQVNNAAQNMEKKIYEAEMEYLRVIPKAYGEAKEIVLNATANATKLVYGAEGEAGRFDLILSEYQKYREITNDRLYLEAMNSIFHNVPNTIIDSKINSTVIPLLLGDMKSTGGKTAGKLIDKLTQPAPTATTASLLPPVSPTPSAETKSASKAAHKPQAVPPASTAKSTPAKPSSSVSTRSTSSKTATTSQAKKPAPAAGVPRPKGSTAAQ